MQKLLYIVSLLILLPACLNAQNNKITISGIVKDSKEKTALAYVNVTLKTSKDSSFVIGTITSDEGQFTLTDVKSGSYYAELTFVGYQTKMQLVLAGELSAFLDLGTIELSKDTKVLDDVTVTSTLQSGVSEKMDKKTFNVADNVSQAGGSVLQVMNNLPVLPFRRKVKYNCVEAIK
jgi:hypothetical protein